MVVSVGTTRLGRGATCFGVPGVFEDGRISREHASLTLDGARLELRDLESRNGSLVNGVRVGQVELAAGDVITLGKMVLVVGRSPALYPTYEPGELVGASHAYATMRDRMQKVASHPTVVLFNGPPGSGKNVLARQLHADSGRRGKMVTVVCGAIDEAALHSELFGHRKGAFAGATRDRKGLIETAKNGTLLLDAVADASPKLQVALLRFLETGQVRRLGADDSTDVDVRVIATTTEPLDALIDAGTLRREFADRLRGWEIMVAPLDQRREDIGLLADLFLQRYGGPDVRLHPELLVHLLRRDWSGNARELEAFIELAVIESDGAEVIKIPAATQRDAGAADTPPGFRIAEDGAWFQRSGEERVDIRDRKNLAYITRALTEHRRNAPGRALGVPELLAAGWPGERVEAKSGANRVYVALTALRRLGLRDLITRIRDGYLIAADAPVEIVPSS